MLDKIKIVIIDFDDSFTFNIASELYTFENDIEVIGHRDFFSRSFSKYLQEINSPVAIILGPGPGSPNDYQQYFFNILELKNHPQIFLMGICLGHQMIGVIDGLVIKPSKRPIHGEQVIINLNNKNMLVQRYNSLALIDPDDEKTEIQMRKWDRGVSYQFHPESIGTKHRELFFRELLDFIKK